MAKSIESMKKWERQAMPDAYFEKAKVEFREFYNKNLGNLQAAEKAFRNLVVLLLNDGSFPEPKVTSRLKDLSECIRKFDGKYRPHLEVSGEEYRIEEKISDLIGLRVVCLYESDIPRASDLLCEHFRLLEKTDKTKSLEASDNEFGYKGLHLDLILNPDRQKLPEYKRFANRQFEVQIRTIVQDAWSEVDHKLKYKKETPTTLRRRIYRLAALFELADQEFESIRDKSSELERAAKSNDFDESSKDLDAFGFLRVASPIFSSFVFYGDLLDDLVSDIRSCHPEIKVSEFREGIEKNIDEINKYKEYLRSIGNSMTPPTQIRHCLYSYNKIKFEDLMFAGHRKNFDRWQSHRTVFPHEVRAGKH